MFLKRKILSFIRKIIGINQLRQELLDQLHDIRQELDSTGDKLRYEMRFTKEEMDTSLDNTRDDLKYEMLYTQQELDVRHEFKEQLQYTKQALAEQIHNTKQELMNVSREQHKGTGQWIVDSQQNIKQELAEQIHNTKQELMDLSGERHQGTGQWITAELNNVKQDLIHKNNKIMKIITSMILHKDKAKIFYLDTPEHGNIGDQAIAYSALCLLKDLYPEHKIIEFTYDDWLAAKPYIIEYISDKDMIFLHGGGNMGDIWINEEAVRRSIINSFPNNKIISMAQSITFNNKKETKTSQDIYADHSDFTIIARDQKSSKTAKTLFPNNKHGLCPDSVLYLEEYYTELYKDSQKDGVLFILRSDKEKARSDKKIKEIKNQLKTMKIKYSVSDTTVDKTIFVTIDRKLEVEKKLAQMSNARLIVTDRYHGLIFSVITGTPCIVFKSLDHKISEGFKWVKHLDWVFFADSESDLTPIIQKYVVENQKIDHPKTFKKEIFSFYKNLLEK